MCPCPGTRNHLKTQPNESKPYDKQTLDAAIQTEGTHIVTGRGEKSLLCDPMVDLSYERQGAGENFKRREYHTWDGQKPFKKIGIWMTALK